MTSESDLERSRKAAIAEVERLLGIVDPTVDRLVGVAATVLGQDRAKRSIELARLAPLTRREVPTSAIAALILGTQEIGVEWWTRPHEDLKQGGQWVERGTPDGLLESGHAEWTAEHGGSCLDRLGQWISDDAADKRWGRPVDYVDLNDLRVDDRVVLPAGARVGDRLTASWDPGGRVWVDIVERQTPADPEAERRGLRRGRLGSRLGESWYNDVEKARWAWGVAIDKGPIRLAGEVPGEASDPFSALVDEGVSGCLLAWAHSHGATAEELGAPWATKDALWSARIRLGLPYSRSSDWYEFDNAMIAAVDGDQAALTTALEALGFRPK